MASTILQPVSSALSFLVPLFAIALLVFTMLHPPAAYAQFDTHTRTQKIQTLGAYLAIGSLATLCATEGAIGLGESLGSGRDSGSGMRGRGEASLEALIFLELGVAVLYLAREHIQPSLKTLWAAVLVIELVCAIIVSFIYPPISRGSVAPFLPAVLSLLFVASLLPLLVFALRVHMAKHVTNNAQTSPLSEIRTPSFSGTRDSTASASLPSPSSRPPQEKVPSPNSSISDFTAVSHYRIPRSVGNRHVDPSALESGTGPGDASWDRRLVSSRSTNLLVLLVASQASAFVAFALEIAAVQVGVSMLASSAPSSATSTGASAYAVLQIFRTALMVLCINGIMAALLLHAYNAYLRAGSPGSPTADTPILPPTVNLSRMNAITVSISTTAAAMPPISPSKKRPPHQSLLAGTGGPSICGSEDSCNYVRKTIANDTLSRHSSSASYSSSFACSSAKNYLPRSSLLCPETIMETAPPSPVHDSNPTANRDEDDGEPGYAYIYTDVRPSPQSPSSQPSTDPLNVGLAEPFRPRQRLSIQTSGHPSRPRTPPLKHATIAEESTSLAPSTFPVPFSEPIDIAPSKFTNPYPTPRSTPTTSAFAGRSSSPDVPHSPSDSIVPLPLSRASTTSSQMAHSTTAYSSSEGNGLSSSDRHGEGTSRTSCSSHSTHTPQRASTSTPTPIPTPTRAPTPGLGFTPFLGAHVRKRDSSSSNSRACPPSPSSPPFMAHLKDKAKKLSSKHDSISESLSQSFEGIRRGLGGSNGRTKYPLRSSTSAGSLGLGLGMTSGFKFPQLTRRASELGNGRRNGSNLTLAETVEEVEPSEEDDFMTLKDPFACPHVKKGGVVRTMSQAELGIWTGRESRAGYREDDLFDGESARTSRSGSYGKTRGMRMSAWGRLPLSPTHSPHSSSPSATPHSARYLQCQPSPTPKSKHRGEKKVKSKKTSKAESSRSAESSVWGSSEGCDETDIMYEEAMIAQQLLMKLDEKLCASGESA